jgi:hypothetical protein
MVYVLVLLAAAIRLVPHPPNFAPVAALGLFCGAVLQRRAGWSIPLLALLASDAVLGFYSPVLMAFVYGGFLASGAVGRLLLRSGRTAGRIGAGAVLSAVVFFAVSNFGVWAAGGFPHGLAGLARSYVMALPFFGNTLAGDLAYSALLFGLYETAERWARRDRPAESAA